MGAFRIPWVWPIVATLLHLCTLNSATYYEASMPYKQEILNATEVTCGSTVTVQPGEKYLFDSRSAIIYESLAAQRNDSYYYSRRKRDTVFAKILPEGRAYHGGQGHGKNYGHGGSYGGGGSGGGGNGGYKGDQNSGGYHNNGESHSHSLPSCTWTYIASPNCSLEAYIVRFKAGDLNCYKQQLIISDNKTEFRMCGNAKLYPAFRSETGNLTIKFFREAYTYRHVFKGYVTCTGRGVAQKGNTTVSITETIRTQLVNGNEEITQIKVKETKTQELLSHPMLQEGQKQFKEETEIEVTNEEKIKNMFGNKLSAMKKQIGVKKTDHVVEQTNSFANNQFSNNKFSNNEFSNNKFSNNAHHQTHDHVKINVNEMNSQSQNTFEEGKRLQDNIEVAEVVDTFSDSLSNDKVEELLVQAQSPQQEEIAVKVAEEKEIFGNKRDLNEEVDQVQIAEVNVQNFDNFEQNGAENFQQEVFTQDNNEQFVESAKVVVQEISPSVAHGQQQREVNQEIEDIAIKVNLANLETEREQQASNFEKIQDKLQEEEIVQEIVESDQNQSDQILTENKIFDETQDNSEVLTEELETVKEKIVSSPQETFVAVAHHQTSSKVADTQVDHTRNHPSVQHHSSQADKILDADFTDSLAHPSSQELEMQQLLQQAGIMQESSHNIPSSKVNHGQNVIQIDQSHISHQSPHETFVAVDSKTLNNPNLQQHANAQEIMLVNPQQQLIVQSAELINDQGRTMPSYTYPVNQPAAPIYIKYPAINQYNPSIYSARNFPEEQVIGRSREEMEEDAKNHPYAPRQESLMMTPIPYRQTVSTYPYITPASGQYTYLVAAPTNPNMKYIVNCQLPPPYPCTPPSSPPTYAPYTPSQPMSVAYGR